MALEKAGIVFIGPNPHAIAAMGDKIESKKAAAKAKVSTVPGHLGEIADAKQAVKIAGEIGYPVMIKASAGGGGKGMRIAYNAKEAEEGFGSARSEAKSSFGDDRVFIEKFIENPRHIEIQVLGDKHGNIIYLGERECSIQRRNQKVIEEAPSPLLDAKTRKAMGEQAVALSKAVGYDSAGTVEFVAGQDRSFYFLEMNTRLQVEHPVTELVTGIDLVEQMIRVAAGEKLQAQAGRREARRLGGREPHLRRGPLPQFPALHRPPRALPPAAGGQRGRAAPCATTPACSRARRSRCYYDPMIAKLVTHGSTREAAIDLQADALDAFVIDGVEHNIPFLAALMQHPRWREGRLSTGFIAEEYKGGFKAHAPQGQELQLLAAVAIAVDHLANARRRQITHQMHGPEVRFASRRIAQIGDEKVLAHVEGPLGGPIKVAFLDERGKRSDDARAAIGLVARRSPCGPAWCTAGPCRCRCGPSSTATTWPAAASARRAYVYTEREAALAAPDAGEGPARHLQAAALPHARAGQGDPRGGGPGGQDRRGAVRGRGHEDGEHPARRARRRGQGRQGQARRQPRRRRGDHGIRVSCRVAPHAHRQACVGAIVTVVCSSRSAHPTIARSIRRPATRWPR